MNDSEQDVDSEAAADAFGVLADDTRVDILLSLPQSDGIPFADLQRASGIEDSGRFNYHLDKLVGLFVHKSDAGYRLTSIGARAVDLLLDARFGPDSPPPIDRETDTPCPACSSPLRVRYEDGDMRLICTDCGAIVQYGYFPPRGRMVRDEDETLDAYSRQVWREVTLAHRGLCPHCGGVLETAVDTDPEWGVDYAATGRCQQCSTVYSSPLGARLLADPDVMSFLADHGEAIDERRFWEFDFYFDGDAVTVASEDPPRYRLTVSEGEERLEVTLDGDGDVVETARCRPR